MEARIVSDPNVCSGKPVVRGTRVMVRQILGLLGAGESMEAILASYPSLTREDIEATTRYAIDLVDDVGLISLDLQGNDVSDGKSNSSARFCDSVPCTAGRELLRTSD